MMPKWKVTSRCDMAENIVPYSMMNKTGLKLCSDFLDTTSTNLTDHSVSFLSLTKSVYGVFGRISLCPINSHYMRFENIKLNQDRNVLLNFAFDHYTRSETTFQWGLEC